MVNNVVEDSGLLDRTYAALSDPTRRALLTTLRAGDARISDLAAPLPMSFAAVSRHVGVLEDAGLIEREVRGREHWLSVRPEGLRGAEKWIHEQSSFWTKRAEALRGSPGAEAGEGMTESSRRSAIVRRVLAAPPEVVYDEWLDPEALAEFIAPHPATAGAVEVDARLGGTLSIAMVDPDRVVQITGEFLELDRPHRMRFTWNSALGTGFKSVVTVTFDPHGDDQTLMTIRHDQLPTGWAGDHERGWTLIAAQLDHRLQTVA